MKINTVILFLYLPLHTEEKTEIQLNPSACFAAFSKANSPKQPTINPDTQL